MMEFLRILKSKPDNKKLLIITMISILFFIVIMIVMSPFQTLLTEYTIIDFEFSWTAEKASLIMQSWGEQGLKDSITLNYVDFLYMIAYATMGFCLGLTVTRKINNEKFQNFGFLISTFPIISALFDVVENINLLIMQYNPNNPRDINAIIASICAGIKFTGLIIALIYFFIALLFLIIKKKMIENYE